MHLSAAACDSCAGLLPLSAGVPVGRCAVQKLGQQLWFPSIWQLHSCCLLSGPRGSDKAAPWQHRSSLCRGLAAVTQLTPSFKRGQDVSHSSSLLQLVADCWPTVGVTIAHMHAQPSVKGLGGVCEAGRHMLGLQAAKSSLACVWLKLLQLSQSSAVQYPHTSL